MEEADFTPAPSPPDGTFAHEAVVLTAQARATDDSLGYAIHSSIVPHYIVEYGTEEQKRAWLPKLASGEWVAGEAGAKGISPIGIPVAEVSGFDRGRDLAKIGMQGSDTRELAFTDMRVPVANLLGAEEGRGFTQMMQQLPQERLCVGVSAVANMEKTVELTIAYAKDREAFGHPLLDFQNTGFELAECSTDALAARTFLDHCIALHLRGELDAVTASRLKYWTTDLQNRVLDRCLQLFGGYGFMAEYPIARMFSGARVQRIYAGSNEIMKVLIHHSL